MGALTNKLKYDVFVFDFDGTLVQSNEIKYNAFFTVTNHLVGSRSILENILNTYPEFTRKQIFKKFIELLPGNFKKKISANNLISAFTKICERQIIKVPEVPGAKETLVKLNLLKKRVFISSATPTSTLKKIIEKRGISHLIEEAFGAPTSKVDHLIFIHRITNINSNKIVLIGDSDQDYFAAEEFKCDFIGIEKHDGKFSGRPKVVLTNLIKLLD